MVKKRKQRRKQKMVPATTSETNQESTEATTSETETNQESWRKRLFHLGFGRLKRVFWARRVSQEALDEFRTHCNRISDDLKNAENKLGIKIENLKKQLDDCVCPEQKLWRESTTQELQDFRSAKDLLEGRMEHLEKQLQECDCVGERKSRMAMEEELQDLKKAKQMVEERLKKMETKLPATMKGLQMGKWRESVELGLVNFKDAKELLEGRMNHLEKQLQECDCVGERERRMAMEKELQDLKKAKQMVEERLDKMEIKLPATMEGLQAKELLEGRMNHLEKQLQDCNCVGERESRMAMEKELQDLKKSKQMVEGRLKKMETELPATMRGFQAEGFHQGMIYMRNGLEERIDQELQDLKKAKEMVEERLKKMETELPATMEGLQAQMDGVYRWMSYTSNELEGRIHLQEEKGKRLFRRVYAVEIRNDILGERIDQVGARVTNIEQRVPGSGSHPQIEQQH